VGFGQDGNVSTEGFETRYTTELANEYGNLASRTLAMVSRYRDGAVPAGEPPAALVAVFEGAPEAIAACFDRSDISGALEQIWERVRELNRFVAEQAPWQLAKDPAQAERLDSVLYGLVEGLRVVSLLLLPIVPEAAERLLIALGAAHERSLVAARFGAVAGGAQTGELPQLFPKIEREPSAA